MQIVKVKEKLERDGDKVLKENFGIIIIANDLMLKLNGKKNIYNN
jgi:hypothetical protein